MARLRKPREDGGGIPESSAGCVKCDADMEMIDDVHHKDGSICSVMARNYSVMDRSGLEPLGRYDPRKDGYGR